MFAGLPGIGIGGVFYMLLAGILLFRALWQRLTSTGRPRWTLVGGQTAMVLVMAAILVFEGDIVIWGLQRTHLLSGKPPLTQTQIADVRTISEVPRAEPPFEEEEEVRRYMPSLPYVQLGILSLVISTAIGISLAVRKQLRSRLPSTPDEK